jgi:hypothetical protein
MGAEYAMFPASYHTERRIVANVRVEWPNMALIVRSPNRLCFLHLRRGFGAGSFALFFFSNRAHITTHSSSRPHMLLVAAH